MPKKSKTHEILIGITTSQETDLDDLLITFSSCIDYDETKDHGILITSFGKPDKSTKPTKTNNKKKTNGIDTSSWKEKLSSLAKLMKAKKWWHYYVGICGVILVVTLLAKWAWRFLAWLF